METLSHRLASDLEPTIGTKAARLSKQIMKSLLDSLPIHCTSYQYTYVFMRASSLAVMTLELANGGFTLDDEPEINSLVQKMERIN